MGEVGPERVMQLITGGWAAGVVGAGAAHSVFTHLDAGAGNANELAKRAGISERGAQVLLDGLTGLGLIELADGTYRNAPEAAAFLVEDRPGCLAPFAQVIAGGMGFWSELPEVARTGVPVKENIAETPENPFWEQLVPAIAPLSVPSANVAAEALGIASAGEMSILDVGGGSGVYSAVWLGLNPKVRATQLDWAPVNAIARRLLGARGLADRFDCIDGDFHTTEFGDAAYDVAVYSHIAHQEGPADNVAIFRKFRRALRPGGTLVVNDFVVEDDRSGPPFSLLFAAQMLLDTKQGSTWRRTDYRSWLTEAGFGEVSFHPTPTPATVILAR